MFEITENDVIKVYQCLKDKYILSLTSTFSLDDGYTIDTPIIVGEAHRQEIRLYACEGIFVLDVLNNDHTAGTHWHPQDTSAAANDIADFMSGRSDYPLQRFSQV